MSVSAFIQAARLRTLPLAIAGAFTGNLLAFAETGSINFTIFYLCVTTAVLLQILSNYANDYGDFKNGADTLERTDRMMASGRISETAMKVAIGILIVLALVTGISLLAIGVQEFNSSFWILLAMGVLGILAAYFYTAGKQPYGYAGFGDLSVFVFFGLLSVVGSYYLQTKTINSHIWWVAAAIGLFSVGVLNVNNIRDIESDTQKNKITIAVRLGYKKALLYQLIILFLAVLFLTIYSIFNIELGIILVSNYLIFSMLIYIHYEALKRCTTRLEYNKQLKFLSLLTLGMMLYFCLSEIMF
ncbi:MAG: 1,4-dihydroxy-2-naphthoate octaprenyltransferase [Bacteroidia bacterium]